jgi:hypothetical protein
MPWLAEHLHLPSAVGASLPSAATGACPKTSKVDGSVNKSCLTLFLLTLFCFP